MLFQFQAHNTLPPVHPGYTLKQAGLRPAIRRKGLHLLDPSQIQKRMKVENPFSNSFILRVINISVSPLNTCNTVLTQETREQ